MSVIVVGLSRKTVPLDLLERTAISRARLPKALADLGGSQFIREVALLSTCHRTEVYAAVERFHGAVQEIRRFLCEQSDLAPDEISDHLYTFHDDAAASHLFGVAAGLDSVVVGETQILGQVRQAWEVATEEGTAGTSLAAMFRNALEVGKRVRTETAIARGITSLAQAAVVMAEQHLGSLEGRRVVVVGAGEMGEGVVARLTSRSGSAPDLSYVDPASSDAQIVVASRSASRAGDLARRAGGEAVALGDLSRALSSADLVLCSISAPGVVIDAEMVAAALPRRGGRDLLVVDLGMPRNVDRAVADVDGVTLLDLDAIGGFVESGLDARRAEVPQVREAVATQVEAYLDQVMAREVASTIGSLHDRAEAIRVGEIERHRARLSGLDAHQRRAVESLTRGIIGKLLHDPTTRLREAAGSSRGERLAESLADLFDLGSGPGEEGEPIPPPRG